MAEKVIIALTYLVLVLLYFSPLIVAHRRRHRNETAIGVFNFFLGWTFLGWVIALVWAFSDYTHPPVPKIKSQPGEMLLTEEIVSHRREPHF